MNLRVPALLLAGLLLLPATSALSISWDSEDPLTIANEGATDIAYTVSADCANDFLMGATASIDVSVTIPDAPTWLNVSESSMTLDGSDCVTGLPSTTLTQGGTITIAPDATAPGMIATPVTLDANGDTTGGNLQVAYKMGYDFTVNGTFPMEVGPDGLSLPGTLRLYGNARSMAMFEILEKPECVSVAGIPDFFTAQDAELAGDLEVAVPLTISVNPCGGEWTEDKIVFKTWSHFLDDGAAKTDDVEITWTFVPSAEAMVDEDNGSPGAGALVSVLALLGTAFVALRRLE